MMSLYEPRGEWKLEAQAYGEFVINKAPGCVINGHGGSRRSATSFGAPEDRLLSNVRGNDAEMEGRMPGAGYVAVNGFGRPRTAPAVRSASEVDVRAARRARTPPKGVSPAVLGRPRRPAAPRRGQVKAAIAHSVLQTLSSLVQNARHVALRRSFSWHS